METNSKIAACRNSIARLCRNIDLSEGRYPYLPTTFSLWRSDKFAQLVEEHKESVLAFHDAIDTQIYDQYLRKVEEATQNCLLQLQVPQSQKLKKLIETGKQQQLVRQYCRVLAHQLTLIEKFIDLIRIPYGIQLNQTLKLREEIIGKDQTSISIKSVIDNQGQQIALKGIGKLGASICDKFIVGMVSLLGGINIAGLAGGIAITKLFDLASNKVTQNKQIEKLKQQLENSRGICSYLEERYALCRKLLRQFLTSSSQDRNIIMKQYRDIIGSIFDMKKEDMVIIKEAQNGWKVVEVIENDEFEQL